MKKGIFIIILISSFSLFSQNDSWFGSIQFGVATLEAKNSFKTNAILNGSSLGKEIILNNKVSLNVGVEHLRLKANIINAVGNQMYLTNNYVNIPISIKMFYNKESVITPFAELGVYGGYLYKSVIEDFKVDTKVSEKNLGYNLGIHAQIGLNYRVSDNFNFNIAFKSKSDLLSSYKSDVNEFKIKDAYLLQMGFNFNI